MVDDPHGFGLPIIGAIDCADARLGAIAVHLRPVLERKPRHFIHRSFLFSPVKAAVVLQ